MPDRGFSMAYFNDRRCRSFAELRSTIVKAHDLALRDAEIERAAAAVERWLLAELEKTGRQRSSRRQPHYNILYRHPQWADCRVTLACPPSRVRSCPVKATRQP
jgi:hypothetical protein